MADYWCNTCEETTTVTVSDSWERLCVICKSPCKPVEGVVIDLQQQLLAYDNRFNDMDARLRAIQHLVDQQADDEGLWTVAQNAVEDYLQQELRTLHRVIENPIGEK